LNILPITSLALAERSFLNSKKIIKQFWKLLKLSLAFILFKKTFYINCHITMGLNLFQQYYLTNGKQNNKVLFIFIINIQT
jgi:hypothetical protein